MFGSASALVVLDYAVPFFVLGSGVWVWVLVANVPRARWRQPRHLIKAGVCSALITVGLAPVSLILGWALAVGVGAADKVPAPHAVHRSARP